MAGSPALQFEGRTGGASSNRISWALAIAGTIPLIIGGVWLLCWFAGVAARWSAEGVITVKTNMALGQVLGGAALLCLRERRSKPRRRLAAILAAVVLLIGALTLAERLFQFDFGIDQLLAVEAPGAAATSSPNRMGPYGAISLALVGAGLLSLALRRPGISPYLGLAVCIVNLLPATGYLYGIQRLFARPQAGIAWPSVAALVSLGLGLVLARRDGGPMELLLRRDPGGTMLRRLLPAALLAPIVVGLLEDAGERAGLYDTGFGTALMAFALAVLFSAALWLGALRLSEVAAEETKSRDALQTSEKTLRVLIENAPVALAMFDRQMRYIYASRRWLKDYSLGQTEMRGISHYEIFPEISEEWKQVHRRALAGEALSSEGECFQRSDGSAQWVRWGIRPWHDSAGTIAGVILFSEDISERKKAEEAIARQAELLRISYDAVILWRLDGGIESWNLGAERLYGYRESEVLGLVTHELLDTVHPKPWPEVKADILKHGQWEGELQHRTRDGREVVVSARKQLIRDAEGVERILEINRDISDRKRQEALLQRLNRTLTALHHSGQALLEADDEQSLLNRVCRIIVDDCGYAMTWVGYAEDDECKSVRPVALAGLAEGYLDLAPVTWDENAPSGRGPGGIAIRTGQLTACRNIATDPRLGPWREQALKRGFMSSLVLPLIYTPAHAAALAADSATGNGHPARKAFGVFSIYASAPDPFSEEELELLSELAASLSMGIGGMRVRAAHRLSEEALRATRERLATTLRSIGDAVISTDAGGKIVFMNDVAQKLTGWTLAEAEGRDIETVFRIVEEATRFQPESPVVKVLRSGRIVGLANHTLLIRRDGMEIPIEDSGAPIRNQKGEIEGVVLVFHDVSEQRKVEAALRSSERLATTGRLAATIAHEIHNPLDAVGNLLFMIARGSSENSTRQYAAMAADELARVTQMTRSMLAFQRESTRPVQVRIGDVFDAVSTLWRKRIENARVRLEVQVDYQETVMAMPGELRQIVSNLVGNALEAMDSGGGLIRLHARTVTDWRHPRKGLCISVADNGPGIPENIRRSIFDPFFTTKGEGGTGLGLWITADLIRKYGGSIRVRTSTRPGRSGTCFSVFLPIGDAESPQP